MNPRRRPILVRNRSGLRRLAPGLAPGLASGLAPGLALFLAAVLGGCSMIVASVTENLAEDLSSAILDNEDLKIHVKAKLNIDAA